MTPANQRAGFSLVEVVLALGICAFCSVALQGLLLTGLNANRASTDDLQTANIAARLLAQRRANPTNADASALLPSLATSSNNGASALFLTATGESTTQAAAVYRLVYDVQTDANRIARVALTFTYPAAATQETARTRRDIVTYIAL